MLKRFQEMWERLLNKLRRRVTKRYKTTKEYDKFEQEEIFKPEAAARRLGNDLPPLNEEQRLARFMNKRRLSPFPEDAAKDAPGIADEQKCVHRAREWCKQHGFKDPFPIRHAPKA